jgi:hypothetical protein
MNMKSETEVDIAPPDSEHPKRPWVTPSFARLDLTDARASFGGHTQNDGTSTTG